MSIEPGDVNVATFLVKTALGVIAAFVAYLLYCIRELHKRVSGCKDAYTALSVKVAEKYVHKNDINKLENMIREGFRDISDKLDKKKDK